MVDFIEICNLCARKAIIEAAKRIINSDKVCHSYSDLNFGVTFFGTQCIMYQQQKRYNTAMDRLQTWHGVVVKAGKGWHGSGGLKLQIRLSSFYFPDHCKCL